MEAMEVDQVPNILEESEPGKITIYCTSCSVQSGANKKQVKHEVLLQPANIIKTYSTKKKDEKGNPVLIGYAARVKCPEKEKQKEEVFIRTYIKKSKAEEILSNAQGSN